MRNKITAVRTQRGATQMQRTAYLNCRPWEVARTVGSFRRSGFRAQD